MNTEHCSKRMVWKWMRGTSFELLANSYRVVIILHLTPFPRLKPEVIYRKLLWSLYTSKLLKTPTELRYVKIFGNSSRVIITLHLTPFPRLKPEVIYRKLLWSLYTSKLLKTPMELAQL